jgi:RNA polymerase sigma-70 factor (ECF subfamily)
VRESDEAVFKRVQAGDQTAFAVQVDRYHRRAFAVGLRLLGSRTDAEDAAQQAFLRLYENRTAYNPRWRLNTWFYRILTNDRIDELRRSRPMRPQDGLELPAADMPDRALAEHERDRLLQAALATVPVEVRIVLTLYYLRRLRLHQDLLPQGLRPGASDPRGRPYPLRLPRRRGRERLPPLQVCRPA